MGQVTNLPTLWLSLAGWKPAPQATEEVPFTFPSARHSAYYGLMHPAPHNSEAGNRRFRWLGDVAKGLVSAVLAVATAASLCRVPTVLGRNPLGWADTADLAVAVLCVFAIWGFYRFLTDLLSADAVPRGHPGHLAWWLAGGVWVTGSAVDLVVEGSSHQSNAVQVIINLGAILAGPLLLPLLVACLRRHERTRAGWRAWAGLVAGCSFPVQYVLFVLLRD